MTVVRFEETKGADVAVSDTEAEAGREPVVFRDVTALLEAQSVAVIGASDRDGNIGGVAMRHLVTFGFEGDVWPVHPTAQTVAGRRAYASLDDLPRRPDLAIIGLAAEPAVDMAERCGRAGIPGAVIWAGGFAESGEKGKRLQARLQQVAAETGLNVCGPNCLGFTNTSTGLTASYSSGLFDVEELASGAISLVSQSGGVTATAVALAGRAGYGFRHVVSVGNEAVLSVADFVNHFVSDDEVRVITVYMEGVQDGRQLTAALHRAHVARKPVIVLKGGRSPAAAAAAKSHTAALAGVDAVFSAVMERFGVVQVGSVEELLDTASFLSSLTTEQLTAGRRVAIVSTGGGGGVLSADQCHRHGLEVPPLPAEVVARVQPHLTPLAAISNPTDLTPDSINQAAWRAQLPEGLRNLARGDHVDAVLFLAAGQAHRAGEITEVIRGLRQATDKPVCVSWPAAPLDAIVGLAGQGVYAFPEHERAARALGHLGRYQPATGIHSRRAGQLDAGSASAVMDAVEALQVSEPATVHEHRCRSLLEAARIPVAAGREVTRPDDLAVAATAVGYPVVLKAIAEEVTHRHAAGLVALNLGTPEALLAAADETRAAAEAAGSAFSGWLVEAMVGGDWEFLVSAITDAQFGLMISVGVGGVLTEVLDDVAIAPAPLSLVDATELIGALRAVRSGALTLDAVALNELAALIARFSELSELLPWQDFAFELNPCKVSSTSAVAVDALLIVNDASRDGGGLESAVRQP